MIERVLGSLARTEDSYLCADCGHVLGPVDAGYRAKALRFDDPITVGEPTELSSTEKGYVLRHYCCPGCATLFEVEMVPAGAGPSASVKLAAQRRASD